MLLPHTIIYLQKKIITHIGNASNNKGIYQHKDKKLLTNQSKKKIPTLVTQATTRVSTNKKIKSKHFFNN